MVLPSINPVFRFLCDCENIRIPLSAVPARLGLKAPALAWLRRLRLSETPDQAKAVNQGLALAWPGPGRSFLCIYCYVHFQAS